MYLLSLLCSLALGFSEEEGVELFSGRITDRNDGDRLFKVTSENEVIKLFKTGDEFIFKFFSKDQSCRGYVKDVEAHHFVFYSDHDQKCLDGQDYFRIGSALIFKSKILFNRLQEAKSFSVLLKRRRADLLEQFEKVNHFIFTFEKKKIKLLQEYDIKIMEIKKARLRALEMFNSKKKNYVTLQKELNIHLDQVDHDIKHYRVNKKKLFLDRWHLNKD